MLVPREASKIASDRPASAPRSERVVSACVARTLVGVAVIVVLAFCLDMRAHAHNNRCVRTHTLSRERTPLADHDRPTSSRHDLFDLIGVLARRRYQTAERSYAPLGLNHTEARLLRMLDDEAGPSTQDALSRRLSVDRTNAGRAFKRLEQGGYVSRRKDDDDSRANLVDITAKGRAAAAEIRRLGDEMALSFFGDLTERDAATILRLLRKAV
jgi:DNA-binding MarR family transcriptional regulator